MNSHMLQWTHICCSRLKGGFTIKEEDETKAIMFLFQPKRMMTSTSLVGFFYDLYIITMAAYHTIRYLVLKAFAVLYAPCSLIYWVLFVRGRGGVCSRIEEMKWHVMLEKERGWRLRSVLFLLTLCVVGVVVNGSSYRPPLHSLSRRRSEVGLYSVILSVGTNYVISFSYSL